MTPSVEEVNRVVRRGRVIAWNAVGMLLILTLFGTLGALHVRLGGFSTSGGTVVALLIYLLFFSPIIDRCITLVVRARARPWFDAAIGVVNVSTLLAMVVATAGLLVAAWATGSWDFLFEAARELVPSVLS